MGLVQYGISATVQLHVYKWGLIPFDFGMPKVYFSKAEIKLISLAYISQILTIFFSNKAMQTNPKRNLIHCNKNDKLTPLFKHSETRLLQCVFKDFITCNAICIRCQYICYKIRNSLQWRYNEHDGVSNHNRLDFLLDRLFRHISKKNIKAPRHWSLRGESTGDRWIPHTKGQ